MKERTAIILKRTGIVVVALSLCYCIALISATSKLSKSREALKATDRPTTLEQIVPAEIPDNQNAALNYQAAVLHLKSGSLNGASLYDLIDALSESPDKDEWSNDYAQEVDELVKSEGASLALRSIREGVNKPGCRFDIDYTKGAGILLPHLTEQRRLSRFLTLTAKHHRRQSQMEEAWNTVELALKQADALKSEPLIISQLVRLAQQSTAINSVRALSEKSLPTPDQLALIKELVAGQDDINPMIRATDGERICFGETVFNQLPKGLGLDPRIELLASGPLQGLLKPMLLRDQAAYTDMMLLNTEFLIAPYEKGKKLELEDAIEELPAYCILTRLAVPALGSAKIRFLEHVANVRMTLTGLTMLEARQATGTLPAKLDSEHTATSTDPFSKQPLLYVATDSGFTLCSVGSEREQNASCKAHNSNTHVSWHFTNEQK